MAIPDEPPLTREQVQRLAIALRDWVGRHPAPDDPVLALVGSTALSPRQLAQSVEEHSDSGRDFLRMVHFGLEVVSFDKIVAGFAVGRRFER